MCMLIPIVTYCCNARVLPEVRFVRRGGVKRALSMDKFDKLELDRASLQGLEASYFDLGDRTFLCCCTDLSN